MRPIAADHNALRHPLNDLLGTGASVRLLRVLAERGSEPIGASEAADQTGLTEAGARRALRKLAKTGFVRRVGGGRSQLFGLREDEPLLEALRALFRVEDERYRAFLARLRSLFSELSEVELAWVDSIPTGPGEPFHVGVLSDSRALTYLGDQIRQRIEEIEQAFEITLEVHAFSRADLPEVDWESTDLLVGQPPLATRVAEEGTRAKYGSPERRAAIMSEAIAELVEDDPSLIQRAARHVDHLLREDQGMAAHDLKEWSSILSGYSRQRLVDFLVSDAPRAERLRQSSPFFAVLSGEERDRVLDHLEEGA